MYGVDSEGSLPNEEESDSQVVVLATPCPLGPAEYSHLCQVLTL